MTTVLLKTKKIFDNLNRYTLMLFLFEYRGAKTLISEQFPPDIGAAISSFRVDSDIVSLNGREALQADAEVGRDGKV